MSADPMLDTTPPRGGLTADQESLLLRWEADDERRAVMGMKPLFASVHAMRRLFRLGWGGVCRMTRREATRLERELRERVDRHV